MTMCKIHDKENAVDDHADNNYNSQGSSFTRAL